MTRHANDNHADICIFQDGAGLSNIVLLQSTTSAAEHFLKQYTDGHWHGAALVVEEERYPGHEMQMNTINNPQTFSL